MEIGSVTIHWKRILITAILSELLIFVIYCLALLYARLHLRRIAFLDFFGLMFLGGLWVAYKIKSHFVLHGVLHGALVGVAAIILYIISFIPWIVAGVIPYDYGLGAYESFIVQALGSTLGGFVGGRINRRRAWQIR